MGQPPMKYLSGSYEQRREHPKSPSGDLKRLRDSTNRTYLLRTHVSLFCFECHRVEKLVDVFDTVAKLSCSHRRSIADGGRGDVLLAQIKRLEADAAKTGGEE